MANKGSMATNCSILENSNSELNVSSPYRRGRFACEAGEVTRRNLQQPSQSTDAPDKLK